TTTFGAFKRGLVTGPGLDWAGRVVVVDIGIPDAEVRRGITTFLLEASDVATHVPRRPHHAHKGIYGRLLIVAGSLGKTGAAALAARAAMRSGAGLVTVATATSQQPIVAALVLEAMTEPLPETSARSISLKARDLLDALAETRDAVAAGPGLGLDDDTQALAREFAHDLRRPLVLDADALTALAGHLDALRGAAAPRCLTPHPGELARMLGQSLADVERDRIETARSFATAHGVHLVLKGAGTGRSVGAMPGRSRASSAPARPASSRASLAVLALRPAPPARPSSSSTSIVVGCPSITSTPTGRTASPSSPISGSRR